MVRNYKRKTPAIDRNQLEKAKKAVANGESLQSAARGFGLAYSTLRTYCGDASKRVGTRNVITQHRNELEQNVQQ